MQHIRIHLKGTRHLAHLGEHGSNERVDGGPTEISIKLSRVDPHQVEIFQDSASFARRQSNLAKSILSITLLKRIPQVYGGSW